MILQKYKIHDWTIYMLISVNVDDTDTVIKYLNAIDCPESLITKAETLLQEYSKDIGFTYSNFLTEESVMVIGEVSTLSEILNTISHECYHLVEHIKIVNLYTDEDCATIIGDFILEIFDNITELFNKL